MVFHCGNGTVCLEQHVMVKMAQDQEWTNRSKLTPLVMDLLVINGIATPRGAIGSIN